VAPFSAPPAYWRDDLAISPFASDSAPSCAIAACISSPAAACAASVDGRAPGRGPRRLWPATGGAPHLDHYAGLFLVAAVTIFLLIAGRCDM
jgi:hypothetical protein